MGPIAGRGRLTAIVIQSVSYYLGDSKSQSVRFGAKIETMPEGHYRDINTGQCA